ncbi:Pre-mRNA-splicing factor SPF27 [Massariosphaeria phaeospora]|uniref:Pre-mRNA-splicing factor SPF27 n=1 Tax=Massariosphaeria phaeospora TaxID=100035 RepID=A0A7C8M5S0_9PLEO|nr:Pre-mRNA-splicing factor SPF27 [Massariosphaeria phaeospora]
MPLIHESYDSLPYVDAPPDQAALATAKALIDDDIKSAGIDTAQLHPLLIPAAQYTPRFPDAIEQEHARLQKDLTSKLSAIDLKRYEELEAPPNTTPTSDEDKPELLEQWTEVLKKAYTSSEYIEGRLTELGLLEKFGKNAWLIGNSQLEDILKAIEAELADVRKQQEDVETVRRSHQENVHGEIHTLEDTWKRGVGRVLETEVAAEGLKQQILERRRAGAV